jgi:hypothetical protein
MGVEVNHCFGCDTYKPAQRISDHYFCPGVFYTDIRFRDNTTAPEVDLYVSGFPCRPWSRVGRRQGLDDHNGCLGLYSVEYIKEKRPAVAILENVMPPGHRERRYFQFLRDTIRGFGYQATWHKMNTRDWGLPQNRPRVWLVCIRSNRAVRPFRLPCAPGVCIQLADIIEPLPREEWKELPATRHARSNVIRAYEKHVAAGVNIFEVPVVVNIVASLRVYSSTVNYSMCLTRAHAAARGYWISTKGGTMNVHEMALLHGITKNMIDPVRDIGLGEATYGGMLGDTMSLNVLCPLLASALFAAGFTDEKGRNHLVQRAGW